MCVIHVSKRVDAGQAKFREARGWRPAGRRDRWREMAGDGGRCGGLDATTRFQAEWPEAGGRERDG